jgi:hypothetical protein
MLDEPKCFTRKCEHYDGVDSDGEEDNERHVCEAFPKGIPDDIAYGDNLHLTPDPRQINDIVYQPE